MKADHAAYMKVSDQFKLRKSDFHAANKSLEIYRAGGIGTPSGQRRVLKQALQAAELWADTGVAACQARLDFMIKFRNVFDQESTTRHIKQAELSLLSSRTAKENAKEFQETLDKTRVNPGMNW
ncbi:hypothetical protein NUW58_g2559 [Xylaria curta]|uniref:Uncharacterized protein n=1 Tax=Xylaria curta TaxID=42375 RepID=A0ACC1PF02_9PEZI|nr:hypothetical protein NUW58_g2559 [Xylaria curta]